jgi:hypothetical protein
MSILLESLHSDPADKLICTIICSVLLADSVYFFTVALPLVYFRSALVEPRREEHFVADNNYLILV